MDGLPIILVGALLFFPILYYVVRDAVEEGTLKALKSYEKLKDQESKSD